MARLNCDVKLAAKSMSDATKAIPGHFGMAVMEVVSNFARSGIADAESVTNQSRKVQGQLVAFRQRRCLVALYPSMMNGHVRLRTVEANVSARDRIAR